MRRVLLLGAFAVGISATSHAQDVSVLIGGVSARYADSVAGSAGVLGGRFRFTRGPAVGGLEASVGRFIAGDWAAQLAAQGLAAWALDRADALGIAFGGSLNSVEGGLWAATVAGGPLIARNVGPLTTSFAMALGGARSVDSSVLLLRSLSLGARYETGPWLLETATVGMGADTLRYLDWTTGVTWQQAALSLGLSAGVRAGDLRGDPWGQLRLDVALNTRMHLEAAIGAYPRDVTGFTGGRFATLGLRVGVVRSESSRTRGRAVRIQRLDGDRARITVEIANAKSVAIAGDWNDWSPAPMSQTEAGGWTTVIRAGPGVHRYALLVDGTRWAVPQGAPRAPDDFGGPAALLVIPET